jgi:putative nucleotidyltransferase with HDIG domain
VRRLQGMLSRRTDVSAGVAAFGIDGLDAEALHHAADIELYARKHGDRAEQPIARELAWAAALASCVDEQTAVREQHSRSVAETAASIAAQLGWADRDLGLIRLAATLHDVGKVHVPAEVLRKRGPLTHEEMSIMARHPGAGAEIVSRVAGLEGIADWIRHSHERVDGTGYPGGLSGIEIPMASRILFVADAYDAMTSGRTYQRAIPAQVALIELRAHAGTQFDPAVVDALEAHLAQSGAAFVSAGLR